MNKPIPLNLLIHSATYHSEPDGKDSWGQPISVVDIDLTNVRIDPSNELIQTADNREMKLNSLMFFDVVNSGYQVAGVDQVVNFQTDTQLTFNGRRYTIVVADPLYGRSDLHHYEVGLV